MTMIYPADPCVPPYPVAKTVREVELECLLRECLPFVLVDNQPSDKTLALIARVVRETE